MELSGTGIWSHALRYGDPAEIAATAAELDELGYTAAWIPDVGGDVLGAMEHLLRSTDDLVVATGIVNVWMHDPGEVAARRASWNVDWQRRSLFGLGVSHAALIDGEEPGRWNHPIEKMTKFLDSLDTADVPLPREARVLAALRPRMLALARDRARGAHPYFVPAEHVARAREILGPEALLAVELAVVRDRDPSSARETARQHTAVYVGLPNYTNNLRGFGFGDDDFADAGSDRLIDAIVAWGDDERIRQRAQELRDAGANHVCIQVIRADDEVPRADWRELAPVLRSG